MPLKRRAFIATLAIAALVIGSGLYWGKNALRTDGAAHRGSAEAPATVIAGTGTGADEDEDLMARLPPESSLAPWMRAQAVPRRVGEPEVSTRRVRESASAGGSVLQLTADRHRYTLYVPPGAVAVDAQLELAQVAQLPGLPFAMPPQHVVRIVGLPRVLQRPAVLTIEPATGPDGPPASPTAAFVVDPDSRELHAYPFVVAAPAAGDSDRVRAQLLVGRDGFYGVAAADPDELAALDAIVPTDAIARLEAMAARALRNSPAPVAGSAWARWSPIASAHAQATGAAALDEAAQRVVQALRDYYTQKLHPRLQVAGRGCTEKHREFFATTLYDANRWTHAAVAFGIVDGDDAAPLDPTVNPYAYHAEAARRAQLQALAREFADKAQRLRDLMRDATRRMYDSVNACCRKSPEPWMPPYLLGMHRQAAFHDANDELGGAVGDAQDCACAVAAVRDGIGWTGTIRQTDRFSHEQASSTSRSKTSSKRTRNYSVDVILLGAGEDGAAVGMATSSGESSSTVRRVDSDWACAVDEAGSTNEVLGARGVRTDRVGINVRKDGDYRVTFPAPVATGLQRHRQYSRREGCKNRFNDRSRDETSLRAGSVAALAHRTISGRTDVATVLRGSATDSRPDPDRGIERVSTLEWNLRACSAR